jgi:hypothetical protein
MRAGTELKFDFETLYPVTSVVKVLRRREKESCRNQAAQADS